MDTLHKLLYKELYKKSFYDFVKGFWHTADPAKFVDGKLIQYYCEVFQYMCKDWVGYKKIHPSLPLDKDDYEIIDVRQDKRNLCLNVPPRHTKSIIFNVFGPVWLWLNYPIKAVSVSHTGGLATSMNSKRYAIINSPEFKDLFGEDIKLSINTSELLKDTRGGELYSQNRNAMTGYGGDLIINDDLVNAEQARKDKTEMSNAWSYYQTTMPSRINDPNKCIIMNIQQRLAPNDITGHILNDEKLRDQYAFITLPAIFSKATLLVCPITGDIFRYKKGDSLWPERFGNYDALRFQIGESIFQTQYLQKPESGDTIIKESQIIEKSVLEVPSIDIADMVYASHDFPVKDKKTSDMLGSLVAYRVKANLYIIDCLETRMAFVKSVEYVKALDTMYPGIIQIIEDKANGSPILQQLQDEVAGMQPFQPGTQSKMQRLESATVYLSAGNIIFVKTIFDPITKTYTLSESLINLRQRLINYPFVEADDIVDAFSQLLLFVFMDRRYMVYGRSFNDLNVIDTNTLKVPYRTVFFNKDGDIWKALEIGVIYGSPNILVVHKELIFKGSIAEGLIQLKAFAPDKNVFIDASPTEGLSQVYTKEVIFERYYDDDFERSVGQLAMLFDNGGIKIDIECKLTKADIDNQKYDKNKDEAGKFRTRKDGFVACIRSAMKYYGGI